eukprot:m51a1_g13706 hypothetical protein (271) ;mRNA; f:78055-79275
MKRSSPAKDRAAAAYSRYSPTKKQKTRLSFDTVVDDDLAAPDGVQLQCTLPSDTMLAMMSLRDAFPLPRGDCAPLALRSQVLARVIDRTAAERELLALRERNEVREVQQASEDCVILTGEYVAACRSALAEPEDAPLLAAFVDRVLPSFRKPAVAGDALLAALGEALPGPVPALDHATRLMQAGLLTQQAGEYWFAVPNASHYLRMCAAGRRELVALLKRRRFSEALVGDLARTRLRSSTLSVHWHLQDLRGLGQIAELETCAGAMVRLV